MKIAPLLAGALFVGIVLSSAVHAEATPEDAHRTEVQADYAEVLKKGQRGPAQIQLLDQASLSLPSGMLFADAAQSRKLMNDFGNRVDDSFVGLILPMSDDASWMMVIDYTKEGYVADTESKDIDADKIIQGLREGTEASNKFRVEHGASPLEVVGWAEAPSYDTQRHTLVWAAIAKVKNTTPTAGEQTVNYNTRLLGREGYFSLNMIDSQAQLKEAVPIAKQLISATSYEPGKRYSDFNASTDHIAEYGLLALIGGVAAKKLGLLALLGVGLLKVWKIALVALAVFAGKFRNLFRRKAS